jgi:hypothetical protein
MRLIIGFGIPAFTRGRCDKTDQLFFHLPRCSGYVVQCSVHPLQIAQTTDHRFHMQGESLKRLYGDLFYRCVPGVLGEDVTLLCMMLLTGVKIERISVLQWTFVNCSCTAPNATISTLPSELRSSCISINIVHLMLARRDKSSILPLQHTFQQSQTLSNVDGLYTRMNGSSVTCEQGLQNQSPNN